MAGYVLSGKAARALTKIVRGTSKSTTTDYSSATVSYDGYPAPYTVRWSQMENSGYGAWVIWLPDITKLVMYDKSYITPSGVTAATELVAGWYTINAVEATDTAVWLNLHIPDSGSPVTASFSNSADTATTGESVVAILVAQMSTDATEGYKLVKQFVDSAILLGGSGGGGDVPSGYSYQDIQVVTNTAYDPYTHTFTQTKRTVKVLVPTGGTETTTNVFVAVPHVVH